MCKPFTVTQDCTCVIVEPKETSSDFLLDVTCSYLWSSCLCLQKRYLINGMYCMYLPNILQRTFILSLSAICSQPVWFQFNNKCVARDTQYYCPALLEHKCHLSTLTEGIKDDKNRASAGAGNQTCNHMNSVSAFQLKCNWEHTVNSGLALRPSPSDHTETFLRWSQNSLIEILWRLLKRLFSLPQRLYKKKAHYNGLICPFFSKPTFIPFQHRGKTGHQNSMFSAA